MSDQYQANLKYEAVLLCIGLLLGGNSEIQATFEEFLVKDHQNLFVLNLKDIIKEDFGIVQKRMTEKNLVWENILMEDQ